MTQFSIGPHSGINVRAALQSDWPRLYKVAYAWCHDPHLARDLAQETVARALRSRERMPNAQAMTVWLFKIMHNCWMDQLRRQRPTVDVEEAGLVSDSDPERCHHAAQISARIHTALASLSESQRQVFTLAVLEGMSYEQVAAILEIPTGTVMSRLWRARQRLQALLIDLAPPSSPSLSPLRRVK